MLKKLKESPIFNGSKAPSWEKGGRRTPSDACAGLSMSGLAHISP